LSDNENLKIQKKEEIGKILSKSKAVSFLEIFEIKNFILILFATIFM